MMVASFSLGIRQARQMLSIYTVFVWVTPTSKGTMPAPVATTRTSSFYPGPTGQKMLRLTMTFAAESKRRGAANALERQRYENR